MCVYVLVVKPERKRQLERHRNRWEDSIKMDLKDIGRSVDRTDLDRNDNKWAKLRTG